MPSEPITISRRKPCPMQSESRLSSVWTDAVLDDKMTAIKVQTRMPYPNNVSTPLRGTRSDRQCGELSSRRDLQYRWAKLPLELEPPLVVRVCRLLPTGGRPAFRIAQLYQAVDFKVSYRSDVNSSIDIINCSLLSSLLRQTVALNTRRRDADTEWLSAIRSPSVGLPCSK